MPKHVVVVALHVIYVVLDFSYNLSSLHRHNGDDVPYDMSYLFVWQITGDMFVIVMTVAEIYMANWDSVKSVGTISTRKSITDPLFYVTRKTRAMNLKIPERHLGEKNKKSSVYTEVIGVTILIEAKFHVGVFIKTYFFFGYRRHLAFLSKHDFIRETD